MTTEEFQSIVLKELKGIKTDISGIKTEMSGIKTEMSEIKTDVSSLKEGQKTLEEGQKTLEEGQKRLETRQTKLEINQLNLEKKVDAIYEQTASLSEFREETKLALEDINKSLLRTEIATADNWSDIARLKSIR